VCRETVGGGRFLCVGRLVWRCRLLCVGRELWSCRVLCVDRLVWNCRLLCVGDRCGFLGYCVR